MPRHRAPSRLISWVFVAALLLKSAVPMLASAAAGLQGRGTAELCDVYGVDLATLGTRSLAAVEDRSPAPHRHDAPHAGHAHHPDRDASTASTEPASSHGPASRVAHGADHCALSGLAFALASDAPGLTAWPPAMPALPARAAIIAPTVDPAARWAARLQHAPPASS